MLMTKYVLRAHAVVLRAGATHSLVGLRMTSAQANAAHLCLRRVGQHSERERCGGPGAHGIAVAERMIGRNAAKHVRVTDVAPEEVDALHRSWPSKLMEGENIALSQKPKAEPCTESTSW